MIYRTQFKLTAAVNDFDAAYKYLTEDNMLLYLKGDRRCPDDTYSKITKIEWVLKDESSGYIQLDTAVELTQIELDNISDWVRGQCSDGLGEGFSQQKFAYYEDEGLTGFEGCDWDNEDICAEFDWETNEYKFTAIT